MTQHALKPGASLKGATYRIEKVLGQGSFGITYLATAKFTTQGNLGKMDIEAKVAIKEFFMSEVNERSVDGSTVEGSTGSVFSNYRKKFKKEAENLSKLEHPNIVKVFDVFDENNTTYYVMEFLEGQNLDDYIKQCGVIKESEAIKIISEIGNALSYMHSKRMLHLDIKPKNIMRKSDGKDYLIDFGLSKQFTDDGEPESSTTIGLGTPGYAPVEQAGYKQDGSFPATLDVYALGATLFKMLTGKRPPEATYILNEGFPEIEFTGKNVSDNTRSVLEKAMAPIKKQRFQSVSAFIQEFAEEETLIKPEPTTSQRNLTPSEMLDKGIIAEQNSDYKEALMWYRMAANQRDAEAQCKLGSMYFYGRGVTNDYAEAVKWYRMAAEQGVADAQFHLGNLYDIGLGVPQDDSEAARWYRMAADQGDASAQFNLGYMYSNGQGVSQDYSEALRWFHMAAEQGHARAQYNIGYMYENGHGVTRDNSEARRWYEKAAANGCAEAMERLSKL